jgi:hypothetical protein
VAESGSQSDEEVECSTVEIEDDVEYLRSLDPKEWKVSLMPLQKFSSVSLFIFLITEIHATRCLPLGSRSLRSTRTQKSSDYRHRRRHQTSV